MLVVNYLINKYSTHVIYTINLFIPIPENCTYTEVVLYLLVDII